MLPRANGRQLLITEEIVIIIFQPICRNTFIHETEVYSLAVNGSHVLNKQFCFNYSLQLTEDEIESNTLEEGKFTSRRYTKISLLPQYLHILNSQEKLLLKLGFSYDDTNQDSSELSPNCRNQCTNRPANGHQNVLIYLMQRPHKLLAMELSVVLKAADFSKQSRLTEGKHPKTLKLATALIKKNGVLIVHYFTDGIII